MNGCIKIYDAMHTQSSQISDFPKPVLLRYNFLFFVLNLCFNMRKMKTTITFCCILIFNLLLFPAHAQKLSITDQKAKTEEGTETDSWTAHLDQEVSDVIKSFSDFIEHSYKLKTDKKTKNIYVVEKGKFEDISGMRMDIRAIFQPETGGSSVSFVFSPGYDVYLSNESYKDDYAKAQAFAKNFVRFHYTNYYNKVVADLQSKIKSDESDIKSDESKMDKLKNSINENDGKISAGDPSSQKLKDKNSKMFTEIGEKNADIEKIRKDIIKLQDDIIKANESLKLVAGYQ
jgi:hypothetical protein